MPGSTQKYPTRHSSVDIAIIKHPPSSLLKLFSKFIQMFCFKQVINKSKQNYHSQKGAAATHLDQT